MAQTMYIPPYHNPWQAQMGTLLSNMILSKFAHKNRLLEMAEMQKTQDSRLENQRRWELETSGDYQKIDDLPDEQSGAIRAGGAAFIRKPEQIAEYPLAGGGTLIRAGSKWLVNNPSEPKTNATIEQYNLAQRQGYKGTFTQWKKELSGAGATQANITVNTGKKGLEALSEEMGKALVTERGEVEKTVASLENLKASKALLDSGMITGTGAQFLTNMGNFLSSRLGFKQFEDPVANTQAFAATMGNQVGQIIKQFGSGTGLSDADREYAEKIVGGKITLTEKSIRRLIDINEKAFKNVIRNFNKKANSVMQKPGAEGLPYDIRIDYDVEGKKKGKLTDQNLARKYLERAGGDKTLARQLARQDGWEF